MTPDRGDHRRAMTSDLHPLSWAAWLCGGLAMVLLTSNPLYIALIALSALVVYASRRRPEVRSLDFLLVAGVVLALVTIPLNLMTGSSGATQLFEAPALTLPDWLAGVTFGGAISAESLTYAATHALAIAGILALVCAFNASVDHFKLLKYTPPGLAQLGIVVTMSLLLVPETLRRASSLLESRAVRGHRGGLRGTPGLILPILAESLERSIQRAESLDARGFGRLAVPPRATESIAAVTAVTIAAFGAFSSYYYPSHRGLGLSEIALGMTVLIIIAWRQSRQSGTARLAAERILRRDVAVIGGSVAAASCLVLSRALGSGGVEYLPFPNITLPQFDPVPAVACLLLLIPAAFGHEPED